MPIPIPTLDDRRFTDLTQEARGLIPAYAPEWTNYNSADPGITLLELFAFLIENLNYRTNRVTAVNTQAFLALLNGSGVSPDPSLSLRDQIRNTIVEMRRPHRAVTLSDFEQLAKEASPAVQKAVAVGNRNLENPDAKARLMDAPAHVSVVVIPSTPTLLQTVLTYLNDRRLITTQLHVVGPRPVTVMVQLILYVQPDSPGGAALAAAKATLAQFADPVTGGPASTGWPFGRSLYVSDLYERLSAIPGVRSVKPFSGGEELTTADSARLKHDAGGALLALDLAQDEVISFDFTKMTTESY